MDDRVVTFSDIGAQARPEAPADPGAPPRGRMRPFAPGRVSRDAEADRPVDTRADSDFEAGWEPL